VILGPWVISRADFLLPHSPVLPPAWSNLPERRAGSQDKLRVGQADQQAEEEVPGGGSSGQGAEGG
jgi:hypothetical protein